MQAAGKRYIQYASRSDRFHLWNLSDLHLMSRGCAEDVLKRDIEKIKNDPFALWVGGGDICDFIGYRDKRFDPDAVAEWVPVSAYKDLGRAGMERFCKLVEPIREKCLGLLIGNHELKYELATEHEVLNSWVCAQLKVPFLGYSCMMHLVFCRRKVKKPILTIKPPAVGHGKDCQQFTLYVHHGAGYANTPGGKLNRLIHFMTAFDADIYMIGHVHDKVSRKEPALGIDKGGKSIVQRERLGCVSGSYLKTYTQGYTSYGEMKGYRPVSLGAAVVEICPQTREMRSEV